MLVSSRKLAQRIAIVRCTLQLSTSPVSVVIHSSLSNDDKTRIVEDFVQKELRMVQMEKDLLAAINEKDLIAAKKEKDLSMMEKENALQVAQTQLQLLEKEKASLEAENLFIKGQLHSRSLIEKVEAKLGFNRKAYKSKNRHEKWNDFLAQESNTSLRNALLACFSSKESTYVDIGQEVAHMYALLSQAIHQPALQPMPGEFAIPVPQTMAPTERCLLEKFVSDILGYENVKIVTHAYQEAVDQTDKNVL
ncbi:hypothetical protein MP228_001186 [Amoeboaphelidium protococcarum]|nr:hypothetical protein MP228_001186 [Amoeboaphelidium protococcarum]